MVPIDSLIQKEYLAEGVQPIDQDTPFDIFTALAIWDQLQTYAAYFKEWEMEYRKAIAEQAFPNPKKGVNSFPLQQGYLLKMQHKVNIKIDEALIPEVRAKLAAMEVSLDGFLKWKPSLVEAEYNAVVADETKNTTIGPVLRTMLTTTPAAPSMEIVLPAAAAKKLGIKK